MKIQTLADILAETKETSSQKSENQITDTNRTTKRSSNKKPTAKKAFVAKKPSLGVSDKSESKRKPTHNHQQNQSKATHKPVSTVKPRPEPNALDIKSILQEARMEVGIDTDEQPDPPPSRPAVDNLDNIPNALKTYLRSPEERQAEKDVIKADSRLRWLAFYYLSVREHSAEELKQKLLAKDQDPAKIDELLAEFAEKGYQSDYRTALMLIREGIRKGRGRQRIKQDFRKKKLDVPSNIDELIDMAVSDGSDFRDVVAGEDSLVDGVDWLKLAVEARVKKYGEDIPSEQKEKARQLRFLQYRGFASDVCFEAIKHDLTSVDERF